MIAGRYHFTLQHDNFLHYIKHGEINVPDGGRSMEPVIAFVHLFTSVVICFAITVNSDSLSVTRFSKLYISSI